jgi:uncharacterized membrane protein
VKPRRDRRLEQPLLQRNVAAIAELEKAAFQQRSHGQRVAATIVSSVATMTFVIIHAVVVAVWIYLNREGSSYQFDEFPYGMLILILAVESIVLTTFVLIVQRHETRAADRRSHLNLQISLLAESEMTKVISTLRKISVHLGLPDEAALDPELRELSRDTHVEHVAQALENQLAEDEEALKRGTSPDGSRPAST